MKQLIQCDKDVFIFLNGLYSELLDPFFFLLSKSYFWIPFYLVLFLFFFKQWNIRSLYIVVFAVLTILIADQSSVWMKNFFHRLRPSHNPELQILIHLVNNYRGGKFGFVSSHAANSFGLMVYLWSFTKNRQVIFSLIVFALINSYSRIYLGVHYPADIFAGALLGSCIGWCCSRLAWFALSKNWLHLDEWRRKR